MILFVSDHGEMLGDHLMFQKAKPFQGSIHVPLFISGPERYIGKRGTVRTDLAELRDVMPTLLELAGATDSRNGGRHQPVAPARPRIPAWGTHAG
ncbi:MAG: sulfatase-like hydrolase/transferase [Subdoligranulum sp.]